MQLQIESLFVEYNKLQIQFGDRNLFPIYGAGQISHPAIMLIFMNPTAKNISCVNQWKGIRAPWIGTKNIWKLLFQTNIIDRTYFDFTQKLKPLDWTEDFAYDLYSTIAKNDIYITNFAKCTQIDARPLRDSVFKSYKGLLEKEIKEIHPQKIITFGNQVSENLLSKKISVSKYKNAEYENFISDGIQFKVFPSYYPVGQGQRNMPLAKDRILHIISSK